MTRFRLRLSSITLSRIGLPTSPGQGGRCLGVVAPDAVDLRERDEGVDAFDVDQDAAAIVAGHLGFEDLAGLGTGRQHVPALFATGAVERDDCMPFGAGRLQDHHLDGVAGLETCASLGSEGEHFALRDDGFGLCPDVNNQPIRGGTHDHAFDDFTPSKVVGLSRLGIEEGPHVHFLVGFWFGGCG